MKSLQKQAVRFGLVQKQKAHFSVNADVIGRIRNRVTTLDRIKNAQSADEFKQKLSKDQIEYVDLLFETIIANMSHSQSEKFFHYAAEQALKKNDASEIFFNGFSARPSDITDNFDPIEHFYTVNKKAGEVYKEALSGIDLSSIGTAPAETKKEAKPVETVDPKKAEADAKKAEEDKKVH